MTPFETLLMAHLTGDFLFQTNWMAVNKQTKWLPLLAHSLVYALIIALFAAVFSVALTPLELALIFGSHFIIDRRKLPQWWLKNVMGSKELQFNWLFIVVDQTFHLLVLFLVLV